MITRNEKSFMDEKEIEMASGMIAKAVSRTIKIKDEETEDLVAELIKEGGHCNLKCCFLPSFKIEECIKEHPDEVRIDISYDGLKKIFRGDSIFQKEMKVTLKMLSSLSQITHNSNI